MDLLVQSGCMGNVVGFESLDPRNLAKMKKAPEPPAARSRKVLRSGWDVYEKPVQVLARSSHAYLGSIHVGPRLRHGRLDSRDERVSPCITSLRLRPTTS